MKHDLSIKLPKSPIGVSDLEIVVRGDEDIIGTLAISKGAIEWKPRKGKKPYTLSWSTFDRMMQERGRKKR